jgi:Protein of unknown function (DUF3237)
LKTSLLSDFVLELAPVQSLGLMAAGERRMVAITGGIASGTLAGTIVCGGADWQWLRADGITEISAHYLLRTDTGDLIEVQSEGLRHGPPEVMARLAAGDAVDPAEYYFRTAIRLRTASAAWSRLNKMLALASGARMAQAVRLQVYEVL